MAFFLQKSGLANHFRSSFQKKEASLAVSNRSFHVELGDREKALLAKDPSLSRFKSYKKSVWRVKRIGDVLTIVVVAEASPCMRFEGYVYLDVGMSVGHEYVSDKGCCYEIYVKAVMREEARNQAKAPRGSE